MQKIKNLIKNFNLPVYLISLIYFIFTLLCGTRYNIQLDYEIFALFLFVKAVSFFVIVFGFQAVWLVIKKLLKKDDDYIRYTKYFLFFFLFNIFFIYASKPFAVSSGVYLDIISNILHNTVTSWHHFLSAVFIFVSNSVFPFLYGAPVMSAVLYSLVFVFFIDTVRRCISKKFWFISLLLFCLPHTILWNLVQYRQIYSAYMLLFVLTMLLRCKDSLNGRISYAVLSGVICAVLTAIRGEHILLFAVFPAAAFFLKIFSKKAFIVFTCVFILSGASLCKIQQELEDYSDGYALHNFGFSYAYFLDSNINFDDECKADLEKVYPYKDEYIKTREIKWIAEKIDFSSINSTENAQKCLSRMIIKHAPELALYHLKYTKDTLFSIDELIMFDGHYFNNEYSNEILNPYPEKYRILSNVLACSNINQNDNKFINIYKSFAHKIFYNVWLHLTVLLLIGIYGIIDFIRRRSPYYLWAFAIIFSIFGAAVVFMPYGLYYYFYPAVFCTYAAAYMIIMEICEKKLLK